MRSKLLSAQLALQAGARAWILGGDRPSAISEALSGGDVGTAFGPSPTPLGEQLSKRKAWIALVHDRVGSLTLDEGAVLAITKRSSSLLPVGIRKIEGTFPENAVVTLLSPEERIVGKGVINM